MHIWIHNPVCVFCVVNIIAVVIGICVPQTLSLQDRDAQHIHTHTYTDAYAHTYTHTYIYTKYINIMSVQSAEKADAQPSILLS